MKRILNFTDFINEASFTLSDPAEAGQEFAQILGKTRNVKEIPSGSNKGPDVEAYLKSVGLGPGNPWCQAYVYWALDQLSKKLGITNPSPKSGSVKGHWDSAPQENKIPVDQIRVNPTKVRPGMVFIKQRNTPWSQGGYEGHTGIVLTINPEQKTFTSIEGNTDEQATGEGNKVGINTRKLDDKDLIGFIDWFKGKRTPEFESAIAGGGVKPELPGDTGGTITNQFMVPTTGAPSQNTVGDKEAEELAMKRDSEEDTSLIASLLKPWRPGEWSKSSSVTAKEVRQFLGKPSYSEEYKKAHPEQD